jgi:dihydroxyacetone kinase-like protein
VIVEMLLDATTISGWMTEVRGAIKAQRDYLVQLDAAIGDGDHGINMTRGFDAVVLALEKDESGLPGRMLITAGKTLVSTVGGASGPLWGSALRRAGRTLGDAPTFDGPQLADALESAVAAIVELGAAQPGDKTMIDALQPAVRTLKDRLASGDALPEALDAATAAAEAGLRATVPMQARKGRASYLGERSIGHQDPGATSAVIVIRALDRTVRGQG